MNGMYTGTSHQCMFQPQDQIEVGEDGFKQYDGKPGFLWKGLWVCVVYSVVCFCWSVVICNLHAVQINLNAKHIYLLPPIFYIFLPFYPPPSCVALQSSLLWTWTPWWVRFMHGWRIQWSLRSLMALITPWRLYQSLTIRMMRKLISLLWKASCFTPTSKTVCSSPFHNDVKDSTDSS